MSLASAEVTGRSANWLTRSLLKKGGSGKTLQGKALDSISHVGKDIKTAKKAVREIPK